MAVTGAQARRALLTLPEHAKDAAQGVMDVTAYRVSAGAKQRVAYRTGHLRNHILWQSRPKSLRSVVGVETVKAISRKGKASAAHYWRYLEYGTVKMQARPFLRPAAEAESAGHMSRLTDALSKAGTKMVRSAESRTL